MLAGHTLNIIKTIELCLIKKLNETYLEGEVRLFSLPKEKKVSNEMKVT